VDILERALAARRESRRIALRTSFDPATVIRDIAAIANSGGGAVVLRDGSVTPSDVLQALRTATDSDFADIQMRSNVIVIGEAITPIVIDGVVYVRRGARTVAASTDDLAKLIDRRITMVRKAWLSAVRHVVQPDGPALSGATSVRVVSDPRAPAFRLVDYDKTHPFRQKEVLAGLRERMPQLAVSQFDLLAIRKVHDVDSRPDFVHKPAFGSNQYSVKFVDWLEAQIEGDPQFISGARESFMRARRAK
jgi:hypothetical protein